MTRRRRRVLGRGVRQALSSKLVELSWLASRFVIRLLDNTLRCTGRRLQNDPREACAQHASGFGLMGIFVFSMYVRVAVGDGQLLGVTDAACAAKLDELMSAWYMLYASLARAHACVINCPRYWGLPNLSNDEHRALRFDQLTAGCRLLIVQPVRSGCADFTNRWTICFKILHTAWCFCPAPTYAARKTKQELSGARMMSTSCAWPPRQSFSTLGKHHRVIFFKARREKKSFVDFSLLNAR